MKNALQKIKSFKNRKLSNRLSNYIRRLQNQSRRLQNQLFHRYPAELRRRFPSLNRLPDLRTIQHSPKLVIGLAGGLVGFAFLMILCLRFLLGSGSSEGRQIAQRPAEATVTSEATEKAVATKDVVGEDVNDRDASDNVALANAAAETAPTSEPSSIAQDQPAENAVTQHPATQHPADKDRASQRRNAPGLAEFKTGPVDAAPSQSSQSQSSQLATTEPRDEPALEILAVPEVTSERDSTTPSTASVASNTSPLESASVAATSTKATTTKTVSLTHSDALPFEILEVEEAPPTKQAGSPTPSADDGGFEVLDLEGVPSELPESSQAESESSVDKQAGAAKTNKTLTPQERARLRRFRRIEATIAKHPEDVDKAHRYGVWLMQLGELKRAERFYLWYLRSHPEDAEAFFGLGQLYEGTLRWQYACKAYQRAASLDERHELARIHAARLLATCPEDSVRDGKLAIKYAQEANALSEWPKPSTADILAAAYAEDGNFASAVRVQKWAIRSAPVNERVPMAYKLEMYRNKQPFRFVVPTPQGDSEAGE